MKSPVAGGLAYGALGLPLDDGGPCGARERRSGGGGSGGGETFQARGIAELLPEMKELQAEYTRWLAEYPKAFLDPQFEAGLVAQHEAAARARLRLDSLLPPASASCL